MFNNNTYPAYVSEDHVDEILGIMTDVSDNAYYWQQRHADVAKQLNSLHSELNDFVRDNSGTTDAHAILEPLCEQFALDAEREVTARITITANVVVTAPYTMSLDEVSQALSDINIDMDSWNSDLDISFDVDDIFVSDVEE